MAKQRRRQWQRRRKAKKRSCKLPTQVSVRDREHLIESRPQKTTRRILLRQRVLFAVRFLCSLPLGLLLGSHLLEDALRRLRLFRYGSLNRRGLLRRRLLRGGRFRGHLARRSASLPSAFFS